jgi:ATP-dependent Clp protease protease subunit
MKNHQYKFKAATSTTPAEIIIYGPIGADIWGDGITAAAFQKQLRALGTPRQIDVRINSEGGAVMDARAIYTQLTQHRADITVYVDGFALSAASLIAMAGDTIRMGDGSFFMIHNARAYTGGTADEMRKTADILDQINETMVATYSQRTGQTPERVRDWMNAETWFSANDALDVGFADEIMHAAKAAAFYSAELGRYTNVPPSLRVMTPNRARAMKLLKEMSK